MNAPDEILPCGRPVADLVAQVADGAAPAEPDHQRECPHCRATLAEYTRLWASVEQIASERVHAPRPLVDRAIARVRSVAAPSDLRRVSDDAGSYLVATRAVTAVAGLAARRTAGVRMALAVVDGSVLELTVAAEYGQDLRALADRLRARVAAEVSTFTGLEPGAIHVTIDDVFEGRG